MPRVVGPRIRGFRVEVLSLKMERHVAYAAVGNKYSVDWAHAAIQQAINDPETLEVMLIKTHDCEGPDRYVIDKLETEILPLEEPVIVQHVKMRWRLERALK